LYDPDDPNNQQLLINKKNLPKDVKDFKDQLHQRIYQAVVDGKVADRQELVNGLNRMKSKSPDKPKNNINRKSIRGRNTSYPFRGEVYEQGFRATGEYRQEVQQRIAAYRGTTSERYRANVTDYQRQLEHKSQYHSDRYPAVGRELAQNLQNSSQQVEKQLDQYQALLQSKLSRLKQMNEQIQTKNSKFRTKAY
jgi:hypothetical protein